METSKFYLRKYHTYRGVVRAIVFKGRKHISVVHYDDGTPKLYKRLKMSEAKYMDYMPDYPLAKAVGYMLHHHYNMDKQTYDFLKRAERQEQSNGIEV